MKLWRMKEGKKSDHHLYPALKKEGFHQLQVTRKGSSLMEK